MLLVLFRLFFVLFYDTIAIAACTHYDHPSYLKAGNSWTAACLHYSSRSGEEGAAAGLLLLLLLLPLFAGRSEKETRRKKALIWLGNVLTMLFFYQNLLNFVTVAAAIFFLPVCPSCTILLLCVYVLRYVRTCTRRRERKRDKEKAQKFIFIYIL